jgi:hypothetical protein
MTYNFTTFLFIVSVQEDLSSVNSMVATQGISAFARLMPSGD